jgi:inactive dipeptidyl peptidase 10
VSHLGKYRKDSRFNTISINSYYLATPEQFPGHQHLYRVHSIPPPMGVALSAPTCLTCSAVIADSPRMTAAAAAKAEASWEVTSDEESNAMDSAGESNDYPENGEGLPISCQYFTATFAPRNNEYALIECLGPEIPTSWIYKFSVDPNKDPISPVYLLQNNTELKERVAKIAMPQVRQFPVMISGGYHAQVRLYLPPGLREDEITRYPTVVHVYSGPGTQLVTDRWRIDWNTYLAGTKDYIVTQIDGRGSSGQGYQLLHEVYRKLGSVEVSDQ